MFTATSSHKRRRASARGDHARKRLPGRVVLNIAGLQQDVKGKAKESGVQVADHDARRRLRDVIQAHPFNHRVTCLIPEYEEPSAGQSSSKFPRTTATPSAPCCSMLVDKLAALASSSSALMAKVSLQGFLIPEFTTQHVKGANTVALSVGDLERDDVICLDGQGTLILHVSKDTYQTLGLTGRPSRFALGASGRTGDRKSGPTDRFLIEVPLYDPTFRPGKPGWNRVSECFSTWEQRRGLHFTMIFASSEAGPMHLPSQMLRGQAVEVPLDVQRRLVEDVWLPSLTDRRNRGQSLHTSGSSNWADLRDGFSAGDQIAGHQRLGWDEWSKACCDVAEWRALVEYDADCVKTYYCPSELPLNSYEVPSPRSIGRVQRLVLSGFAHPQLLLQIEDALRGHLDQIPIATKSAAERQSWALVDVEGFANSPVRWKSHNPGWGLALGKGRSPADDQHTFQLHHPGIFSRAIAQPNKRDESSEEDKVNEVSESSRVSSDGKSEDAAGVPGLQVAGPKKEHRSGRAARRKRARQVKRKGHVRRGEAERSGMSTATGGAVGAGASSQGGEVGWTAILFATPSNAPESQHQVGNPNLGYHGPVATCIWWENVEGDTRN